jgi:predicted RNase H-like nuclease
MEEVLTMRTVLGIDAAWTERQPSGVALVADGEAGWCLLALEPSYADFISCAAGAKRSEKPAGSAPQSAALINACMSIGRGPPDLVAVDMPLSTVPIRGRRVSDNAISEAYGSRKAGTHTPNEERPGLIGKELHAGFAGAGFKLLTSEVSCPGLAEVYPHPDLIELTGAAERLCYKTAKTRRYRPDLSASERGSALRRVWGDILLQLDSCIAGIRPMLPVPDTSASTGELKAFEDMLDALVCAWVGCCILEGRAVPYGDADSAIWVPQR